MKALEKDRTRRTRRPTASRPTSMRLPGVGAGAGRPPPSRAYRMRKFVRKHRGAVIAASLVLLTLLAGIVGTTLGLDRGQTRGERQAERIRSSNTSGNARCRKAKRRGAGPKPD